MRVILILILSLLFLKTQAQESTDVILAKTIEDANRATDAFIGPLATGSVFVLSEGWFNSAQVKPAWQFELGLNGSAAFAQRRHKSFLLNTHDYHYLHFWEPGYSQKDVGTALGSNNPAIPAYYEFINSEGELERHDFTFPNGISEMGLNFIPMGFLQISTGIGIGTELKFRTIPETKYRGAVFSAYGGAFQHELTHWLSPRAYFPLHISVLAGYTKLNGRFDLLPNQIELLDGPDQSLKTSSESWTFAALASTKFEHWNVYGGLGYVTGSTFSEAKGTFHINKGVLSERTFTDPFQFDHKGDGLKFTLGLRYDYNFFSANIDYSVQEFSSLTIGINFRLPQLHLGQDESCF